MLIQTAREPGCECAQCVVPLTQTTSDTCTTGNTTEGPPFNFSEGTWSEKF